MHYLTNVLRERSGIDGDGVSLVGQALGGKPPRLRVNKFQTESERNVQKGLEHILMGLYRGIRNPRSHEQIDDTKDTADAIICFINYLLSILAESKEPFTIPDFVSRVFDPDFVESARYAELLAAEIPQRKRTETLVEIYRRKHEGEKSKLKYIAKAILDRLSQDQIADFLSVVSEDLRTTRDDEDIRIVMTILPPGLWPRVDEVARLRVENKLLASIAEGEVYTDELVSGELGTLTREFLEHFVMKPKAWNVFIEKIEGENVYARSYIARCFMSALPEICNTSYKRDRCVRAICQATRDGEEEMTEQLIEDFWLFPEDWKETIRNGLKDWERVEELDAIPF